MNGNSGITPTVELATTNGNNGFGYPYPVMPFYGVNGNDGFFGSEGIWAIILIALLFGNGGWGGFGGFGGGFGGMYEFPWLLNGQQGINTNVNNGFDNLHLSNQIEGARDGINNLATQICGSTADVVQAINGGFSNAEIAANSRQIANMQQAFNSELNTTNGFNNLNNALQNCCCENRLGIANLNSTILSENCADRYEAAQNTRDIIDSANRNSQAILDKLCQLELDNVKSQLEAKNDLIGQLRQDLLYAKGQASQTEQTATLRLGQEAEVDALYNRLKNCPVGTVPVFGNTPIFTCSSNLANGCGCGFNTTSQFI